ncbi:NAD(P)-dependent dehydrogenase, short-chain alcohol dehydrogenase family [Reichenbachiella agariperforans]|uniref:NAD(P)-dependent dehydrogenase, short-chain alcohol dehydrogenase family n=1 Tax=Reichenbachiella agariperforans TaxID=156994 RepID=A0A1M6R6T5_REIAG|nr:SDR family oxidoreductase [Reichenbachiella agariperforans]SHK28185.1 NAD(P)-dependent dehydrogenase, short-chain alcohol dehydrogenase family [Reichenbachiella agariperforans]
MTQRKIALVTGGSRGLGRDMALNIAKKGIDVVITYHTNQTAAAEVVKAIEQTGSTGYALQLDSSKTGSFDSFYEALSKLLLDETGDAHFDYLVNNAGTGIYTPFTETTEAQFDEMMNIHLKGVYFLTQKALPLLNDGGSIINISSGLARFTLPGTSAYASMKGAIEVFTKYLAKELGGRGIRANVVAPGAVATDFGGGTNRDNEQKRALISSATALGRVGEAEDIGPVVAFLCTPDAQWVNAQRIEASGGTLI